MRTQLSRTGLDLVIAPLVGAFAWSSVIAIGGGGNLIGLLPFAVYYSYLALVLLGVPAFLIYRRLGIGSLSSYVVGGFAGGVALVAAVFCFEDTSWVFGWPLPWPIMWATGGIGGAVGAAFFWVVVYRAHQRGG